jgi:hypothetical protein
MKHNNKAVVSKMKSFQRLQYLAELQERLSKNKVLEEAKDKHGEGNYSTSINPIE